MGEFNTYGEIFDFKNFIALFIKNGVRQSRAKG